ncbi:MAG TPA: 3-oxoacyl-[acyl-carrier-protein] synthase III C-terminal domain-containing protein [Gemmataceae bacterium]|nr:3-oxoacyl-[acyl-carrier-protein] synthase III C-terminal domain-containing protein [Gemmataceae bacterium]
MKTISLVGAASYLPARIVDNAFFQDSVEERTHVMFQGVTQRHHVAPDELAHEMIVQAARKLAVRLNLNLTKDVDILMTNVTTPDQPFTGCGADVGKALGCRPDWIIDVHNGGCVSFISMIAHAQALMTCHGAKTALLCNVQNAAGRLFAQEETRKLKQARIPGDGCGVAYLVASSEAPVKAVVQRNYCEYAGDMSVIRADGTKWWEPSTACTFVDFNETKIAQVMGRANRIVPEVIREACRRAELPTNEIGTLITNQPNRLFLRNWREALQVPRERHVSTFERHGNLFGAALPMCLEEAIDSGQLKNDSHLVLGGFAHAGDFAAAAVVHWKPTVR